MVRLRIFVYSLLLISAQSDVSDSTMQIPPPGVHEDHWNKAGGSHPEMHSKKVVPRPENVLRIDKELKSARNGLNIKDCPSDCYCDLRCIGDKTVLLVRDCRYDPIESLSKLFGSYRNITHVKLINCHLTRLPPEITKSPVMIAHLEMNEFSELPQELLRLPQLSQLYLIGNKLSWLPANVTKLSAMELLDLSQNAIVELPAEMNGMRNLLQLNLTHNKLESLPREIGVLSRLLILDAGYNKLSSLPAEVGNLSELKALKLIDNQITTLPHNMTSLKQLLTLELSNNPLSVIPDLPTQTLTQFMCINCSIKTLPCRLLTEGRVQILDLGYNSIKIPECGKIINDHISFLNLDHNSLREIPCGYLLGTLKIVSFSLNSISSVPRKCKIFSGMFTEMIYSQYNNVETLYFSSFCTVYSRNTLRFIGFAYNRINYIDTSEAPLNQCFSPGTVIELQGNRLSTLESWPMLLSQYHSITLDVSENNLAKFASSSTSFIPPSKFGGKFKMQWNKIQHFMDIFNGWKVIVNTTEDLNTLLTNTYFDLSYNPLVCDCVDYEVYRYIQGLTTEQYNDLMCQEPLSLQGKNPHHIPLVQFVCDITLNCPDGCTCAKVPYSQTINITCDSYLQRDIPETMPDLPKQNYGYRLDISNQSLTEITFRPYLRKMNEIRISGNSIAAIKINSSHIFQKIKILHLDHNRLVRLPLSVLGMTNESALEITLGNNPWVCDCEVIAMINWIMKNWHVVQDKESIICHSPPSMVGVKVKDIDRSMVCPKEGNTAAYVIAGMSCVVLIFLVSLSITHRLKLTKWPLVGSDECDGEHKEFDIFMCACSADEDSEYVEKFLIPELEKRDFKVLYHREHFHPGKPIIVNMGEALEKSKRTLVFFSNGFRESEYSMFEFQSAYHLDIQNSTRRLITIKDTDLDLSNLDTTERLYFQTHTYLDREDAHFWKLLEGALPKQRLGGQGRHRGLIN